MILQNKLFGNLGLGSSCSVQLTFAGSHRTVSLRGRKGEIETLPVFTDKDTVSGSIKVSPVPGKRLDHQGIRVQLVGEVELLSERGNAHEFLVLGEFAVGN
jgi:vacuolar protein sorting-associated protein 26